MNEKAMMTAVNIDVLLLMLLLRQCRHHHGASLPVSISSFIPVRPQNERGRQQCC